MPSTKHRQPTRERILTAAANLMYQQGIHGSSVDAILKAAHAGKSQFYHYFANKDAMVAEVVKQHIAAFVVQQEARLSALTSLDDLADWLANVRQWHRHVCRYGGCPIGIMAAEASLQSTNCWHHLREAFDRWQQGLQKGFRKMIAQGVLQPHQHAEDLAALVVAVNQGAALMARTYQDPEQLAKVHRQLIQSLRALATHSPPAQQSPPQQSNPQPDDQMKD